MPPLLERFPVAQKFAEFQKNFEPQPLPNEALLLVISHFLHKKEGDKTAIILPGGGAMGALQAGTLIALQELGIAPDIYIAQSIGSVNLAYALMGHTDYGLDLYKEHFRDGRIITKRRGKFSLPYAFNPLDINYCEKLLTRIEPIDQDAINNAESEVFIGLTKHPSPQDQTVKPVWVKPEEITNLPKVLLASVSYPGLSEYTAENGEKLYGRMSIHDGVLEGEYGDGEVACDPLQKAIDEGATDVLILNTRPHQQPSVADARLDAALGRLFVDFCLQHYGYSRAYMETFLQRYERRAKLIRRLSESTNLDARIRVAVIAPPDNFGLWELSHDKPVQFASAARAMREYTHYLFEK